MLSRINPSIIGLTDSYKVSHAPQYPRGTSQVYSYLESRGGEFDYTVVFGLYYQIVEYLERIVTEQDLDYFRDLYASHFNDPNLFNEAGWRRVIDYHRGKLPLKICAVPEGSVIPTGNVLVTVENTDPELPWLTNYAETLLVQLWYSCTVATLSRKAKELITRYTKYTGSSEALIPFKLHDFGFRGCTSVEQAHIGGAAHLVNFMGTDTVPGLLLAREYYGEPMAGFSIPAAEHSTITSWGGPGKEVEAFRNMIQRFGASKTGLYAVVSDSYDIFHACTELWGNELREEVLNAPNTLVIRPDSGDVVQTVLEVLRRLGDAFGYTKNAKGFNVLNKVRVIQGDGMDLDSLETVCQALYTFGWALDNIAFGMGAGLLQKVNRDTGRFAFKASEVVVDGEAREVYKQPVTDPGKNSKRGRLALVRNRDTGQLETVREADIKPGQTNLLQTVFLNGEYVGTPPVFSDIRKRAQVVVQS